jgi:sigma-B regulation protein RsbU (phosphoserine phosphatase)
MGILDPASGSLQYVNAGHCFPFYLNASDSTVRPLAATGLPLGMFEGVGFETGHVAISPSDLLVLYTDGVTEAMNRAFEEYGEDRFRHLMIQSRKQGAASFLAGVVADVERFVAGEQQSDDLTMMVLKRVS